MSQLHFKLSVSMQTHLMKFALLASVLLVSWTVAVAQGGGGEGTKIRSNNGSAGTTKSAKTRSSVPRTTGTKSNRTESAKETTVQGVIRSIDHYSENDKVKAVELTIDVNGEQMRAWLYEDSQWQSTARKYMLPTVVSGIGWEALGSKDSTQFEGKLIRVTYVNPRIDKSQPVSSPYHLAVEAINVAFIDSR